MKKENPKGNVGPSQVHGVEAEPIKVHTSEGGKHGLGHTGPGNSGESDTQSTTQSEASPRTKRGWRRFKASYVTLPLSVLDFLGLDDVVVEFLINLFHSLF